MTRREDVSVLIVGAGPTGLTLACDLSRRRIPHRIIDQAPVPFNGSRAKGLMPRTLEVFDDLGIIDAVRAAGGLFPPFRGYNGDTVLWDRTIHQMAGFPELPVSPSIPYRDFWMMPQWRTEHILRQRLAELGGRVHFGTALTGFLQDDDGVEAAIRGPEGETQLRAGYLVGADGGQSLVRKTLGIPFQGQTDEADRSIIADVRAEGPDRAHWHMWINPGRPGDRVSLCPLPGTDDFQFVAPVSMDTQPELTLPSLQAIFNERSHRTDVRLTSLHWASLYRVNVRMAERFRVGRVFLAGDAAHVHSPAGGQGLNTGVQDAYNLGWKLGAVLAGAPRELLDSYEAERLPIAADVLGMSSALHRQGFRLPEKSGEARDNGADVYQLNLHYRFSSLSRDFVADSRSVRAGDRAPDATCRDSVGRHARLFDAFRGPRASLLAFGPEARQTGWMLAQRHPGHLQSIAVVSAGDDGLGEMCLVDAFGHIGHAYDVAPAADVLIFIRPDGYIGFAGPGGLKEPAIAYVDALFGLPGRQSE
jgi:2-polyprenyl-6-methoxyphenol hydroxylase-like FAD-dependent oxidoreductase